MKTLAFTAVVFVLAASCCFADSWTGKLVDASCKASDEAKSSSFANCEANNSTHLFGIELADARVLNLDAVGNTKAEMALKNVQKTTLRATVTGLREGQMVKVETLDIH
jgi:hypothetical protein